MSASITYRDAGVDISMQDEAIRRLRPHAQSTFGKEVLTDIGLFGAAYSADFGGLRDPVLVSSTDGVGTKLKFAYKFGAHRNAGIDLVATCVNDIICSGAKPLFFLDYIAAHRMQPEVIEELVAGMAEGCRSAGCSLIGGEIAEMRDTYKEGEYDLAGFAVGVVSKSRMLPSADIRAGDAVIGLASSGIHANGFSLIRKVFADISDEEWKAFNPLLGCSLAEEVTRPTRIYAEAVGLLISEGNPKAIAHISGGGLLDNIPRVLPEGLGVEIERDLLGTHPIFALTADRGPVSGEEMFRTFNMGVGLAVIVNKDELARHLGVVSVSGIPAREIGHVVTGRGVRIV